MKSTNRALSVFKSHCWDCYAKTKRIRTLCSSLGQTKQPGSLFRVDLVLCGWTPCCRQGISAGIPRLASNDKSRGLIRPCSYLLHGARLHSMTLHGRLACCADNALVELLDGKRICYSGTKCQGRTCRGVMTNAAPAQQRASFAWRL